MKRGKGCWAPRLQAGAEAVSRHRLFCQNEAIMITAGTSGCEEGERPLTSSASCCCCCALVAAGPVGCRRGSLNAAVWQGSVPAFRCQSGPGMSGRRRQKCYSLACGQAGTATLGVACSRIASSRNTCAAHDSPCLAAAIAPGTAVRAKPVPLSALRAATILFPSVRTVADAGRRNANGAFYGCENVE